MKKLTDFIPNVIKPASTLAEVDPGVRSVLEEAIADYRSSMGDTPADEVDRRIEAGTATVWELVGRCESPIEKLIVPSLVFQPYGSNGPWVPAEVNREDGKGTSPVGIIAQLEITDSRFDFVIFVSMPGAPLMFAVECDGREFHDEARDFYRDRKWSLAGLPTVRLKGADIHKNPRMAASRVAEFVLQHMIEKGLA